MPRARVVDVGPGDVLCVTRDDGTIAKHLIWSRTFVSDDPTENVVSLDLGEGVRFFAPAQHIVNVEFWDALDVNA